MSHAIIKESRKSFYNCKIGFFGFFFCPGLKIAQIVFYSMLPTYKLKHGNRDISLPYSLCVWRCLKAAYNWRHESGGLIYNYSLYFSYFVIIWTNLKTNWKESGHHCLLYYLNTHFIHAPGFNLELIRKGFLFLKYMFTAIEFLKLHFQKEKTKKSPHTSEIWSWD